VEKIVYNFIDISLQYLPLGGAFALFLGKNMSIWKQFFLNKLYFHYFIQIELLWCSMSIVHVVHLCSMQSLKCL